MSDPTSPPPLPEDDASANTYQLVADTVGGVPSFRKADNLIQGLCVLVGLGAGAGIGYALNDREGALYGALIGLVASLLLSGAILMVLGWRRAARNLRSRPPAPTRRP